MLNELKFNLCDLVSLPRKRQMVMPTYSFSSWVSQYFLKSGKGERAANMLEDHIKSHPSEVGPDILDLLADVLMQINAYDRALKYVHDVRQIYNLGKELPSSLKIRQAICHVRLEEMEQAEVCVSYIINLLIFLSQ